MFSKEREKVYLLLSVPVCLSQVLSSAQIIDQEPGFYTVFRPSAIMKESLARVQML